VAEVRVCNCSLFGCSRTSCSGLALSVGSCSGASVLLVNVAFEEVTEEEKAD